MSRSRRIVIISDTHMGRPNAPVASPDQLRPLWRDASRLIVNGDLAEINDVRYRANAARQVCRLQDLCDSDGVDLTLISGNHDPLLTDQRFVTLMDGQLYATHGDVLHPSISPWSTHAEELAHFNRRALAMLRSPARASEIGRLAASQYASFASWDDRHAAPEDNESAEATEPPAAPSAAEKGRRLVDLARRAAVTLWCWHTLPRRAAQFMLEYAPESRFFIFGHIHRAGIWTLKERVIINTGCYGFPSRPRAVVIEDDQVSVVPVQQSSDGSWCMANRPLQSWSIAPARTEIAVGHDLMPDRREDPPETESLAA